ncbi:CHASE4 domain-containing protein [Altericista sp. CCNU0014]|uniref:CHASE4 domain-containing protein n=1 Tax=Altericista sp. CCNU0014 TaxID=3082949 RepID=UPI003850EED6
MQEAIPEPLKSIQTNVISLGKPPHYWEGLRLKVTSIVAGSFAVLFLTQFAAVRTILLGNFARIEEDRALTNAARLQSALTSEIARLNDVTTDYSTWDETYRFAEGRNPQYVQTQLYETIFGSLKINTIAIKNQSGKLLAKKGLDFYTSSTIDPPSEFIKYTSFSVKDLNGSGQGKVLGVLSSSAGPMLVTSQPILKSEGTGRENGVLSMGRFIDPPMLKKLSDNVQLPVTLYPYPESQLPKEIQRLIHTKLQNTAIAAEIAGENSITSYVRVNDVFGNPALVLKAENDREIYVQGLNSLNYYFWSTLLIGLAFCALVLFLLERFILSRLSHLSQGVSTIGSQGTLLARVHLPGQDELTQLAETINHTLDRLQQAQQALQSSEERYTLAVIGANDGIWDWDLQNDTVYFSPRWEKILGYAETEFEQSLEAWFGHQHAQDLPEFKAAIKAHLEGHTPYLEHEHRTIRKDGTECWVMCRGSAVRDSQGTPYRMAGSLTDISDRKAAAQLLARQAEELARSNQELEQFAYIASHDLQEPLRKIEAFGDRLKRKYDKTLDEQGHDYLARMQNAAGRMRTLIQDLLAFSRVTTQSRGFISLSLSTLLQDVLGDLEVRVQETRARVSVGPMPTLEADALQMRQLFQNLIGNALKFQQPSVPPIICIQCSEERSGNSDSAQSFCRIAVSDNGIGFDEKYLDRIFKVFQRLHGRNEYEGTGIGLAVCAKIVERHGGQLTAQSTPGQGATFIVVLPLEQPKSEGDRTP